MPQYPPRHQPTLADRLLQPFLSRRTRELVRHDLLRWRTRWRNRCFGAPAPTSRRMQLGCGDRRVDGWFNVDIEGGDCRIDIAAGTLPWDDDAFDVVVCQHVIEHLEIRTQLIPLLRELRRVVTDDGSLWLSCPDMEKVCRSYVSCGMRDLYEARLKRHPRWQMQEGMPITHMANQLFHQFGEHVNLFDLPLLTWTVQQAGFADIQRVDEDTLIERFPEFPRRNDDEQSLYVRVSGSTAASQDAE